MTHNRDLALEVARRAAERERRERGEPERPQIDGSEAERREAEAREVEARRHARRESERPEVERVEAERRDARRIEEAGGRGSGPVEARRRESARLEGERLDATAVRRERREPVTGWDDELVFRSDAQRPPVACPTRSAAWAWWLVTATMLTVLAVALRQPIADRLWPENRTQALLAQADAALAQGRLATGDGSGARELYEAALAIDPDRSEARAGLARVALASLAQARAALAQDRFADGHRHLALARALSVPKAQADAVAEELRRRESGLAGIDALVARAEIARREGRLDGDDGAALPLYRRVLELQPGRDDALRGREDALSELLGAARESLRTGDLRGAAAKIANARKYDPGHVDLPDSEARLTEEIDALRRRADADLGGGRLRQAAEGYRALLAFAPDDAVATQGIARVAAAHAAHAQRLAADFEFPQAEAELAAARALAPDAAEVREAAQRLERSRQARVRAPSMPDAERQRRVRALLDEASASAARGDLLTPPGESAFDKLGAARALAPQDPAVTQASARLLPAAQACFERELRGNSLSRARACLDARGMLGEDSGALSQSRRRLAQRWLAVGDERLGAGELQAASSALNSARGLDPGAPGIDEFAARLRAASASGN